MTIPQDPNCSTKYWTDINSCNNPKPYSADGSLGLINCVGVDGKTALYIAAERLDFPAMNILLSYGASIESSGILDDPKIASQLLIYPINSYDSSDSSDSSDEYLAALTVRVSFLEQGIVKVASQHKRNITALHIAARNGALETVNFILGRTPKSEVVLNPNVYFTAQTLEDCSVPSEISLLDQIPLDGFSTPAQSYCNTIVRDTKGVLHTLRHTDAKQVHDTLAARAQKAPSDNRFTVYMNPGHSFVGLDCSSCANGASYHESFGRYPHPSIEGSGVIVNDSSRGKKYSDENLYLKSTFHISDEQAKSIWIKQQSDKIGTKYNALEFNCVDYTMEFASIVGENNFVDLFPNMQFQFNMEAMQSSNAIQYCVAKYKHNINPDQIGAVFCLGRLAIYYVAIKTYSKVSSWLFRKKDDQTPPKPSLTLQMGTAAVARNAAVGALRAVIPINETTLIIARLATSTFTIHALKNEMQTAKPLNEHKPQSLLNTRVSWVEGISILGAITDATTLGLAAIMGKTDRLVACSSLGTMKMGIALTSADVCKSILYCLLRKRDYPEVGGAEIKAIAMTSGLLFLGINEVRKFWHDITAPPNIDGLDLS